MNCPTDNNSPGNKDNCKPEENSANWQTIAKVYPPSDVIIESLLASYNIPVRLKRHDVSQIPVSIGPMAEVEILVPEKQASKAYDILNSQPEGTRP